MGEGFEAWLCFEPFLFPFCLVPSLLLSHVEPFLFRLLFESLVEVAFAFSSSLVASTLRRSVLTLAAVDAEPGLSPLPTREL